MYCMQCTLYSALCIMYCVDCSVYDYLAVTYLPTICSMHTHAQPAQSIFDKHNIQCSVYNVHCRVQWLKYDQ